MVSKVGGAPKGGPPGGGDGDAEENSAIYKQLKKFINVIVSTDHQDQAEIARPLTEPCCHARYELKSVDGEKLCPITKADEETFPTCTFFHTRTILLDPASVKVGGHLHLPGSTSVMQCLLSFLCRQRTTF